MASPGSSPTRSAALIGGIVCVLVAGCLYSLEISSICVVAIPLLAGLLLLPRAYLPAFAVVAFKGFGIGSLAGPVLGQLYVSDTLLLLFIIESTVVILREAGRAPADGRRPSAALLLGGSFFVWAFGVTYFEGLSVTPLLRLLVYVVAGAFMARDAETVRFAINAVLTYAAVEFAATISTERLPSRLLGFTLGDPAQFGGLMLIAAALLLKKNWAMPIKTLGLFCFGLGIAFSQTRSVWFAALACGAVLLVRKRVEWRYLSILVPAVGVGLGLWALPWVNSQFHLNSASGDYRARSFATALLDFQQNPFLGKGWAYASHVDLAGPTQELSAYNLWLYVAASTGVVGLVFALGWLLSIARRTAEERMGEREVGITVLVAMGMSEMPIYAGSLLTLILLFLLCIPSTSRLKSAKRASVKWRRAVALSPDRKQLHVD